MQRMRKPKDALDRRRPGVQRRHLSYGLGLLVLVLQLVLWTFRVPTWMVASDLGTKSSKDGLSITIDAKEKRTSLPVPVQFVERYIQQHSHQTLEMEFNKMMSTNSTAASEHDGRRFMLAYYNGPDRAGNTLHNFISSILWGMITNRTILYVYKPDDTICTTEAESNAFLERADWLPSYEIWSRKWPSLHNRNRTIPPTYCRSYQHLLQLQEEEHEDDDDDVLLSPPQVRSLGMPDHGHIGKLGWRDHPQHLLLHYQHEIENATGAPIPPRIRDRIDSVYHEGVLFLYGLIFDKVFQLPFEQELKRRREEQQYQTTDNHISIVIHSRHPIAADDGRYINYEVDCLKRLLPFLIRQKQGRLQRKSPTCSVVIVSDRPKTVQRLSQWVQENSKIGCVPISNTELLPTNGTNHGNNTSSLSLPSPISSFQDEHGPRSGIGFLQDLALVGAEAASHDAMIAVRQNQHRLSKKRWKRLIQNVTHRFRKDDPFLRLQSNTFPCRSSTGLLLERIQYKHMMVAQHQEQRPHPVAYCPLPFLESKYSYGPGTPTFEKAEGYTREEANERLQFRQQVHARQKEQQQRNQTALSVSSHLANATAAAKLGDAD